MANRRRTFIPKTKELKYRTPEIRTREQSVRSNQMNKVFGNAADTSGGYLGFQKSLKKKGYKTF